MSWFRRKSPAERRAIKEWKEGDSRKFTHAGQAVVLAVALLAGPVVAMPAANAVTAQVTTNLAARHSNKCLTVTGRYTGDSNNKDGDPLIQWTCTSGAQNQEWRLEQQANGYFLVVARHSNKCLTVTGRYTGDSNNKDGDPLIQWTCTSGAQNQEWRFEQQANGYFLVVARHSNKCLTVTGRYTGDSNNKDGDPLIQWTCTSGAQNQEWRFS
ncbi:RICIN domain-containing protein [Streptosporangium sp. NPDC049078]|uniref:RICIN domain-containing protein n=1 Tax=Streptosporangium sp. NPDC049078 TaxID=3155767 RepID=UPI003443F35A